MANFDISFKNTSINEGGYSNNPHDRGQETIFGISRKNWPYWGGWRFVDSAKSVNPSAKYINTELAKSTIVQTLISEFYKTNFWYPNNLQLINDQQLANNVYDFGVNAGISTAAKRLQMASNSVCGDLVIDGKIGNKTVTLINNLNGQAVYNAFNIERKKYYENIIAHNPSQEQFRKSWMSRIVPYKV